jgi:hypothetical protein
MAPRHLAECHSADWHLDKYSAVFIWTVCYLYALSVECHSVECRSAECRGVHEITRENSGSARKEATVQIKGRVCRKNIFYVRLKHHLSSDPHLNKHLY